jgi:hypothetical protein
VRRIGTSRTHRGLLFGKSRQRNVDGERRQYRFPSPRRSMLFARPALHLGELIRPPHAGGLPAAVAEAPWGRNAYTGLPRPYRGSWGTFTVALDVVELPAASVAEYVTT